jgi:hypothetical protein
LLAVLLFLVAVSAMTILIATGTVDIMAPDAPPIEYIGDAEKACDRRVKTDRGSSLSALSVDDHSSFYDESSGEFKLFYEMQLFNDSNKQSGVTTFYVNCVVSSARGVIAKMKYLEDLEVTQKAIRREHGNAFGF